MADKPQPHTIVHKIGKNENKVIGETKLIDEFENHAHDSHIRLNWFCSREFYHVTRSSVGRSCYQIWGGG